MRPSIRNKVYRSGALAGQTKRYHGWPTSRTQTVGEHSARVANIYVEIFGLPRVEVLYYALNHDAGELFAGDIPFGGKDKVPGLRAGIDEAEAEGLRLLGVELPELTVEEAACLKIADLLEMFEFGRYEEAMGNTFAAPITDDTRAAALKKAQAHQLSAVVAAWISQQEDNTCLTFTPY